MVTASQIRTWTRQGAQAAARRTHIAVRTALERYSIERRFNAEIFLQGSYANHTNTRGDSDVDIVVMMKSSYMPDLSRLSTSEQAQYQRDRISPGETVDDLRREVAYALLDYFGERRVHPKNKCIKIDKTDGYVDADVVPAQQHKLYRSYSSPGNSSFIEGISIKPLTGASRIVNYPKEHIRNGETKNGRCFALYKPTVRQIKQLRRSAVDAQLIGKKDAPGYLLECMTYNVPRDRFLRDDVERVRQVLSWMRGFSPNQLAMSFRSCDEVHLLFQDDPGGHDEYTAARVVEKLWEHF